MVFSKVGKFLTNGEAVAVLPELQYIILLEGVSNHCPLLIKLKNNQLNKPIRFKFCNMWTNASNYGLLMEEH